MRGGDHHHVIVEQQLLLDPLPIALAHADADIHRLLMQVGDRQARLQANADMRVEPLETR